MYYYEFVEMSSLQLEEREVIENIHLILNQEWNYEEVEETKKMIKMFAQPEEVIARFMSIKEIDIKNNLAFKLTEWEKRVGMIDNPEEWIQKLLKIASRDGSFSYRHPNVWDKERLRALSKFVIKLAVFQFCIKYFPKIFSTEIYINERVELVKRELEQWEQELWIVGEGQTGYQNFFHITERELEGEKRLEGDISAKRRTLISYYDAKIYKPSESLSCICDACLDNKDRYKDMYKDMFEIVKNLRKYYVCYNSGETAVQKWKDNRNYEGILEIETMRELLNIMERHLCNRLTQQDIADLRENMQNWEKTIVKLSEMLTNLPTFDLKTALPLQDTSTGWEENNTFENAENTQESIRGNAEEELTEEMREQISAFVENMIECVDDFIEKISSYESEEELYENLETLCCPDADGEYDSNVYMYSTKAKAKAACKEKVQTLVDDIMESFECEEGDITSSTDDYYQGLKDEFFEFIDEFSESYDEYMSTECEGSAAEYISSQKAILFGNDILYESVKEDDLKARFDALVEERFDNQIMEYTDVKRYFALCEYDEEDGEYCYIMNDACDTIYQDVFDLLVAETEAFPEKVFEAYTSVIGSYCEMLKSRLAQL